MRLHSMLVALSMSATLFISGCAAAAEEPDEESEGASLLATVAEAADYASIVVIPGETVDRGFTVDNVLVNEALGDIHYCLYVPEDYDPAQPVALFISLPGQAGLYPEGPGENLHVEEFAHNAKAFSPNMIIAAPQSSDWSQHSADQVIALTEYLLHAYNVDPDYVYLEGYSYGGETLSYVMGTKPELYRAALHCSSQWDGDLRVLAEAKVPVRITLGDNDMFYSVESAQRMVSTLQQLYRQEGVDEEEIARLISLDVKDASYFDVDWYVDQHATSSPLMARDPEVLGWLFLQ